MDAVDKARRLLFTVTRKDLRLEFFRAGGKGGQKQNKTSSACRITHPESGAVGECREERYQHTNRKRALERMVAHPRFKTWVKLKAAAIMQGFRDLEDKVERLLRPANLRIEELVSYTCDGCGKKTEQIALPAFPEGWSYTEPDTHHCPTCQAR